MLTNSDLIKIGSLLDSKLDAKFKKKLSLIAKSIRKIQKDMKTIVKFFNIETHLGFHPII